VTTTKKARRPRPGGDSAARSCPEEVSAGDVRITSITVEGGACDEVIGVLQDWADLSAPSPGPEGWECVAESEGSTQSYKCGRQPLVMRFALEGSG
jgi:hypothetical protein